MPRLKLAFTSMAVALCTTLPAAGEVLGTPAATLSALTVADPTTNETRMLLTFGGALPTFSISGNDAPRVAITFNDARLGPGVSLPTGSYGSVQHIAAVQNYGLMTLLLSSAGSIHVTAQPTPGGAILVTASAVGGLAEATANASASPPTSPPPSLSPDNEGSFEVVPLKYADVSEVVGLLTSNQTTKPNDNFTPEQPPFGSASLQGSYGAGGFLPAGPLGGGAGGFSGAGAEPLGSTIDESIGVDRRLNAIVLRGHPDRVAALKEQITKLDVPVTSVLLETVFVELTQTGARDLGIDWNNSNGQLGTVSYAYAAGSYPGISDTGKSGGLAASFQAAIYAQIAKGEGQIISKPRIAAQSGQTAKIVTGDALPILTSIALSGVNAVQQQVQYVNVGVTLQIAPRVSEDGVVTSHIFAVVSSVTGYSQGYPTISQREATTSATVRDGESFVIGGLTQESSLSSRNKVPLLGDVPIAGALFRNTHTRKAKTDLYVVITPHVITLSRAARIEQTVSPALKSGV